MQDVFVSATANDIRQLAPEQIRQRRFGQIVFVDLPTPEDRAAIFNVHLARRGRNPETLTWSSWVTRLTAFPLPRSRPQ